MCYHCATNPSIHHHCRCVATVTSWCHLHCHIVTVSSLPLQCRLHCRIVAVSLSQSHCCGAFAVALSRFCHRHHGVTFVIALLWFCRCHCGVTFASVTVLLSPLWCRLRRRIVVVSSSLKPSSSITRHLQALMGSMMGRSDERSRSGYYGLIQSLMGSVIDGKRSRSSHQGLMRSLMEISD